MRCTPDIEVETAFDIQEDVKAGTLTITATGSSKQFPATEAFITDAGGNSVFLGIGGAFGDPTDLILAGQEKIFDNTLIININNKGVFQSVNFNGQNFTLDEFNKLGTGTDAGAFNRDKKVDLDY